MMGTPPGISNGLAPDGVLAMVTDSDNFLWQSPCTTVCRRRVNQLLAGIRQTRQCVANDKRLLSGFPGRDRARFVPSADRTKTVFH